MLLRKGSPQGLEARGEDKDRLEKETLILRAKYSFKK